MMRGLLKWLLPTLGFLILALLGGGISLYVEGLWFQSLGYWPVFEKTLSARFGCFLAVGLLSFAFLWLNVRLASGSDRPSGFWFKQEFVEVTRKTVWGVMMALTGSYAFLCGIVAQSNWLMILQYLYRAEAGIEDALFGKDIAYYFFSLPFCNLMTDFALVSGIAALILASVGYLTHGHLGYRDGFGLTRRASIHLTILSIFILLSLSFKFWLARYELLYSSAGVVYGPTFTDVHARLPIFTVCAVLSVLTAASLLASTKWKWIYLLAPGVLAIGYLSLYIYPSFVQAFMVAPNELQKEREYILKHIQSTLKAYRLDNIEIHNFSTDQNITESDYAANQGTLGNIRLWDWRPLKDVYGQLQSIRLYYDFEDIDVDRYSVNGSYRQLMLSVRELDFSRITESAQNWINRHFQYTHGHGLCVSPVNEVTVEGLPEFFVQDIPPRSRVDLPIRRPEIYFGEKTDSPVFVRTNLEEFDYPIGETNAMTTYKADRGLAINSIVRRLIFSWELGIYQILFTGNFNENSRVLLHRRVGDRVRRLVPFLNYDQDPYIVIHEGRLFWIQDAYTTSNRFPYAEPFPSRSNPSFNYIRNSVKVVIDAYLGDVTFYLSDPSDPLINVYSRIFPSLLKPLDEMPQSLREHIRYPVDLFNVQRSIYSQYHMVDATVFYNQEDVWEVPREIYRGTEQLMESYYMIMTLPGTTSEEFILMIPFTPRNKNNMIAWLAARCDEEHYGKLVLYQFPKQELTYGPMQIEARIDQNPDISQLITLWGQQGSRVIRGNLLVIPIEESVLYVEPLYLQAETSEIPELTRVIVVYGGRVALGETLEQALSSAIFPTDTRMLVREAALERPEPKGVQELIRQALRYFEESQSHLRDGNWSAYGEAQRKLGEILRQLSEEGGS